MPAAAVMGLDPEARRPALIARQAVDDRLQHRCRDDGAEKEDEQGPARVVDAELAHPPPAVRADQRRREVQPRDRIASPVQVEAMCAEGAGDDREPGRDRARPRTRRNRFSHPGAVAAAAPSARCEAAGVRQMLAVIGDSANAASIAVHRAAGFAPVGTIAAAGWKFDRWLDVVLMQRGLGAAAATAPG